MSALRGAAAELCGSFLLEQMERLISQGHKVFPEEGIFLMTLSVNAFTGYRLQRVSFPPCASPPLSLCRWLLGHIATSSSCSPTGNNLTWSCRRAPPQETQHALLNFQLPHTLTSTVWRCRGALGEEVFILVKSVEPKPRGDLQNKKQMVFQPAASLEDNVSRGGRVWR